MVVMCERKVMMMCELKAVLFDLDDTLYDHLHSAKTGLLALGKRYPVMLEIPIRELEDRYSHALETVHKRLLIGELNQQQARTRRMQQLFESFGIQVPDDQAYAEYRQFRRDYDTACRCVSGAEWLLNRLQEIGLRLAVVTNNLVSEQFPKLQQLGIQDYFDVVTVSEEVGVAKPALRIFEVTLDRLGVAASQVVMVGDSLSSDVAGARLAGIRTVWLNRRPESTRDRPEDLTTIDRDFADHEQALDKILGRA